MRSHRLLGLALAVPVLCSVGPAAARRSVGDSGGYFDFLNAQAVGELGTQRYDVYQGSGGDKRFIGNADLGRSRFLGGGLGLRLVYGARSGLRVSGESSVAGGWLTSRDLPFTAISTALRGELLGSLGYQRVTGRLVWHVAGVLGCDFMSFKATPPTFASSALGVAGAAAPVPPSPVAELEAKRFGLRAGAQVGAHLQLSELAALYSDVTLDYDGQWRVRFGFAVGTPGRR